MAGSDFWAGFAGGLTPHIQGITQQVLASQQEADAREQKLIELLSTAEDPSLRTLAVAAQIDRAQGKGGKKSVLSGLKLEDFMTGRYKELPAYQKLAPVVAQIETQMQRGGEAAGPPLEDVVGAPPPLGAGTSTGVPGETEWRISSQTGQELPPAAPDNSNAFLSVLSQNAQPPSPAPLAQFAGQPGLAPQAVQPNSTLGGGGGAGGTGGGGATAPGAPPPGMAPPDNPVAAVEGLGFGRDVLGNFGPAGRQALAGELAGRTTERVRYTEAQKTERAKQAQTAREQAALDKFTREQQGRVDAIELKATRAMERVVKAGEMAAERKKTSSAGARPSGMTERDRQLRTLALGKDERDDVLKLETERDKEIREIDRNVMLSDPATKAAYKATVEQAYATKITSVRTSYEQARGELSGAASTGESGPGAAPPGSARRPEPGKYIGEMKSFPNGRTGWWDGAKWGTAPPVLAGAGGGAAAPGAPPP